MRRVLLLLVNVLRCHYAWNLPASRSGFDHVGQLYSVPSEEESGTAWRSLPRLYVGGISKSLTKNTRIQLNPDQSHYVVKVMRLGGKRGRNLIRLFDGVSGEWAAQVHIEKAEGRKRRRDDPVVVCQCTHELRSQSHQTDDPWIIFAPIRKARVKLMLEKCVELGVGRFVVAKSDRTEAGNIRDCVGRIASSKFTTQIIEAAEQSERTDLPSYTTRIFSLDNDGDGVGLDDESDLLRVEDILKGWQDFCPGRHLLICREREAESAEPVLALLGRIVSPWGRAAFLVGPEGGWSIDEEELFDECSKSCDFIHCVSLGPTVLRAETAAMAAVASYTLFNDKLV